MGAVQEPDPRKLELGGAGPRWWAVAGDVLRARGLIERYGLEGWLRLQGLEDWGPHPLLVESLDVVEAELARLEHEDRIEEARSVRRERADRGR